MKTREWVINGACLLFSSLFIYAPVSKIIDFEIFVAQLSKSPLFIDRVDFVAITVPAAEIIIAFLLVIPATRLIGLYAFLTLMSIFSFYIAAILNFSEYVPCSCGGILENMSWGQHLAFNIFFIGLSIAIILLQKQNSTRSNLAYILASTTFGLCLVTILFFSTYVDADKYRSFDRVLANHKIQSIDSIYLVYNSYYFAGSDDHYLYLANETAPSHFVRISPTSTVPQSLRINIQDDILFVKPKADISGKYFFVQDGNLPKILRGELNALDATEIPLTSGYFDLSVPIGPKSFAIRVFDQDNNLSLAKTDGQATVVNKSILKAQVEGHFSVDGMLHYNAFLKRLVYLYYYRNQYMVIDTLLSLRHSGKTIDSIRTAKIKVVTTEGENGKTSSVVPLLVVNKVSTTYNRFLFVNSNIGARNEEDAVAERHSRIDIYDLERGHYLKSFDLPIASNKSLRRIFIFQDNLYALMNSSLMKYNIQEIIEECADTGDQRNFTGR